MESEYLIAATASLIGLGVVCLAMLAAWRGWLALKTRELERMPREVEGGASAGAARIEISDLKERVRKLEAIAAGVDI